MIPNETIVIALGGNALLKRDDKGTFDEQFSNVQTAAIGIADLIQMGYRIVLTHGNGPQVGATLLRHEMAKNVVPPFPLHACNAETQGLIGYMIEQGLQNELDKRGIDKSVLSLVSRIVVNKADQAFRNPTKPVGPYFERHQYPNLINIFDGYRQGAKHIDPRIKIISTYLGDWDNPDKGKRAAIEQIDSGADIILHVADTSGSGVIQAAKEKGIYALGAVGDQNHLAPNNVLTSLVLDIDKAFDQAVQRVMENRFEETIFKPGIEQGKGASGDGIVFLAPFHGLEDKVPADVKALLQQLTKDVIDKKIPVPERFEVTIDAIRKQPPGIPKLDSKLKLALVTDSLFSDRGWGTTAFNAAKQFETKYGLDVVKVDDIAVAEIEPTLRKYAEASYDLIIAHGFQWGDPAVKVAKDYPNTKFVVFTGLVSGPNVASIFPMQQEGSFLLGALAAMMSKTGTIAFVGGDSVDPFIEEGSEKITLKYQNNSKYRRVVASPKPVTIVESNAIRGLVDTGFIVIACGGGGIPIIENPDGSKSGVDAVVDKDFAGQKLASQIGASKFVILTDVEGLYVDFRKPTQKLLKFVKLGEQDASLISRLEEGSMGPKVQACLEFVRSGGKEAIIASLDKVVNAVEGKSGTHFTQ